MTLSVRDRIGIAGRNRAAGFLHKHRCESPHGRQDGFLRKHILPVEGASLRLPMEFFSHRIAGDIQQRQGTNDSVSDTLVNTFASGFIQTLHYCNALAFS